MASTPDTAQERASREASTWLIELQEAPDDPAVRRRFRAWLAADPAHAQAWAAIRHLSQVASALQPELAADWRPRLADVRAANARAADARAADGAAASRLSSSSARRAGRRRPWLAGAAALALAACVALVAGPALVVRLQADAMTDTAEQRRLELPDGSRIVLAAGSAVAVSYGPAERRVRLLRGEAFFQVAPDRSRPFRVATDDVETSVLGTRFDVRRDARGVSVSVEEGVVEVASVAGGRRAVETLSRGEAVRVPWRGEAARSTVPPQLVAAWRQGQLVLHDQPLRDAVDQLRRYYGGTIVIADEALAHKPVTGAYNLADPEDALLGMARAHGAKVRRITPWLIVLSAS